MEDNFVYTNSKIHVSGQKSRITNNIQLEQEGGRVLTGAVCTNSGNVALSLVECAAGRTGAGRLRGPGSGSGVYGTWMYDRGGTANQWGKLGYFLKNGTGKIDFHIK